ncbi:E3 ubiquitin-protein ligase TRIM35-like isoform X1 [Sardina pilchardus]|uniref:E3 ubiquitin-protein ligase TRIM35-like isoform X1 n=1 Tax=Sardina pilchardus TaxID=27697 RepID=UPI002E0FA588
MASFLPEEDLTCTVCCDIFEDPVVLSCSHSVCEDCLKNYWSTKPFQECPLCRRRSSRDNPPVCIALKNLCEAYTKEKKLSGELCPSHKERFKLFCKDDKELLCVVCRDSKEHKTHDCSPIDEAAADLKEEVKEALEPLKDKLNEFKNTECIFQDMAEHIKKQAEKAESRIKEEFEKLHQFLRDEEEARLDLLKEEEEEKSQLMKEKIEDISKKMSSLSGRIKDIEEELKADAVAFLSDFEDTMERAQHEVKESESVAGGLIDVAQHLGNLNFRVWLKMRDISSYYPVIFDPNTAGDLLILSDDLTTVKDSYGRQNLPSNPERYGTCVLGSEGFDSGTYSWDVQVGKHKYWDIGITTVPKPNDTWSTVWSLRSRTEFWTDSVTHSVQCLGVNSPLSLSEPPEIIRVDLDFVQGKLTFSDAVSETKLHTVKHNFTEKLFPFFQTYYQANAMKILPVTPTVVVDNDCDLWIQF